MIALIDGDEVAFRCAAADIPNKAKKEEAALRGLSEVPLEPIANILHSVKLQVAKIEKAVGATKTIVFFTCPNNFRKVVGTYQGYKEKRKDKPKPPRYKDVVEYMKNKWECVTIPYIEADDAVARGGVHYGKGAVLVTQDKDSLTTPTTIYNPVKDVWHIQSLAAADLELMEQLLKGDSTDSIPSYKFHTGKALTNGRSKNMSNKDWAMALYDKLEGYEDRHIEVLRQVYMRSNGEMSQEAALDRAIEQYDLIYIHRTKEDTTNVLRRYGIGNV